MLTRSLAAIAIAVALTSCASAPTRNMALDHARERFTTAQADPAVIRLAAAELERAREALQLADQAKLEGRSTAAIDHLAYMAAQRVTIATETASSRTAQAAAAGAAAERDRMLLAERTNEADQAKRNLGKSEASNAALQSALADADANAKREQARTDLAAAQAKDMEAQLLALNAKKTDHGMVLVLGDVLFQTGQSQLLPDAGRDFGKLAEFFKRNQEQSATVNGYTDSVGSPDANLALSDRRARAVMAELVRQGVPSDRLTVRAHGAEMPTASNATATGRQLNRRVEIVFAQTGDQVAIR